MKTLSCGLLLMAGLALVLAGCSDTSDPILTAPSEQALPPGSDAALGKCGPIVHSANALTVTRVNDMGMSDENGQAASMFKLQAWELGNGNYGGTIHIEVAGKIAFYVKDLEGKIVQLKVVGNKAKFMFEISKGHLADGSSLAGQIGCAVAIDNKGHWQTVSDTDDCWSALAIDIPQVMKDYGFWEMTPDDFINASTAAGFPPQPVGKGDIIVR